MTGRSSHRISAEDKGCIRTLRAPLPFTRERSMVCLQATGNRLVSSTRLKIYLRIASTARNEPRRKPVCLVSTTSLSAVSTLRSRSPPSWGRRLCTRASLSRVRSQLSNRSGRWPSLRLHTCPSRSTSTMLRSQSGDTKRRQRRSSSVQ